MAKNDLRAAAAKGADLFFSAADAQDAQTTQQTVEPHKAQDMQPAQLAETIEDMQAGIEDKIARKEAARKARREEKRINIALTPSGYEFCQIMGSVTGKGMSRFISDLVDREAATNNELFQRAKGVIEDARK